MILIQTITCLGLVNDDLCGQWLMDSSNTEVSGYGPQNLNFVQAMIDVGQIFFQLVEGLEVNYVRI